MDVWLFCLAMNVYFEARSEPIEGQYAVAEVAIRRAKLSGKSICEEVFQDRQFSWTIKSDKLVVKNEQAWTLANAVAFHAMKGNSNFSKGATHFHATYIFKPAWAQEMCVAVKIGRHIFYRPCEQPSTKVTQN